MRHVGKKINILAQKIKRRIGKVSSEYGISSIQAKILGYIYANAGKKDIFQKSIEEEFDIRKSSVTSVLTLMEKNGLIKRVSVSEDARLKKLILTDKGVEIHKSIYEEIESLENTISDALTDKELESFEKCLVKLINKLED